MRQLNYTVLAKLIGGSNILWSPKIQAFQVSPRHRLPAPWKDLLTQGGSGLGWLGRRIVYLNRRNV